jgi:hypothetical protein
MSSQEATCYTVVYEDSSEAPSTQDLRNALQKGSDEVKIDTLRKIIVLTINGNSQVCQSDYARSTNVLRYILLAPITHAYNPILFAVAQQAAKEIITFLLGSLPKVRRKWEIEARDDSRRVSPYLEKA